MMSPVKCGAGSRRRRRRAGQNLTLSLGVHPFLVRVAVGLDVEDRIALLERRFELGNVWDGIVQELPAGSRKVGK